MCSKKASRSFWRSMASRVRASSERIIWFWLAEASKRSSSSWIFCSSFSNVRSYWEDLDGITRFPSASAPAGGTAEEKDCSLNFSKNWAISPWDSNWLLSKDIVGSPRKNTYIKFNHKRTRVSTVFYDGETRPFYIRFQPRFCTSPRTAPAR